MSPRRRLRVTAADAAVIKGLAGLVAVADLARRFGLSRSTVWRIQTGQLFPDVPAAGVVATPLGSRGYRRRNGRRTRLTTEAVAAIRAAPLGRGVAGALARRYGVTAAWIRRLRHGGAGEYDPGQAGEGSVG